MDRRVRTVLVGCGGISKAWLNAIQKIPQVEIVGLVDIVEQAAVTRAREYGLSQAAIGTELGAVLECTRPEAVFNCTVPEAHYPVTLESLGFGCHVLGEKPLADSMEHARAMVAAAKQTGKTFAVIQNRRYDPRIRRLRAFLDSGAIGPLTTLNCDFYIGAHFGGFRDHMRHVLLLDMAIHTFDAARYITAADPATVYCHEWNPSGSWYDRDASAMAIFTMSGNLVYNYRGSWCVEGLNTTWECDWRIIGEQGSVRWNGSDLFEAQAVSVRGGFFSEWRDLQWPEFDAGGKVGGHEGNIREFACSVLSGATPETVADDNIKSLAMVFGAIESAETGVTVKIE